MTTTSESNISTHATPKRVCLVTEEISGIAGSGGIGAAFFELSLLLAKSGYQVDILYCPVSEIATDDLRAHRERFANLGIVLRTLDVERFAFSPATYEKKSYGVFRTLHELNCYDHVHFHDYKGLGFFSVNAKRQGLAFGNTTLVVQLHGPTRWTIETNQTFFIHEDQVKIDHLERESIRHADYVVSPSQYLIDWMRGRNWKLPPSERQRVIQNVCSGLVRSSSHLVSKRRQASAQRWPTDIVLFGRHEDRKGFAVFCDALDLLNDELAARGTRVTFLGKFGMVNEQPSGVYLIDRCSRWRFAYQVRSNLHRDSAAAFLISLDRPVVVVPSPVENSPYTVSETIALELPLICSIEGGGPELLERSYPGICKISAADLADKIRLAITSGLSAPRFAISPDTTNREWIEFHESTRCRSGDGTPAGSPQPKVAFAITHHERPAKLVDAVVSAAMQTYANLELIVVDDGSSTEETVQALEHVERLLTKAGGRLIRRENGYLGAARNTALAATTADYICFLDDDDYAFPELITTLVRAAVRTGADAVNCLNVYMDEAVRREKITEMTRGHRAYKVAYVPTGGPLTIGITENCFGAATALLKVSTLREIGGYTEIHGVGHEDYELFLRLFQAGKHMEVVAQPLYFYEVGRPSMLSRTSMRQNFRRIFDALEVENEAFEGRDLASLVMGKHVAVHANNRQWWLYSLTKTAGLRHRLMDHSLKRQERMQLLVDLANAEGRHRMAAAFEADRRSDSASSDAAEEDFVLLTDDGRETLPAAPPPADDSIFEFANVLLEIQLGRIAQAATGLALAIESIAAVSASNVKHLTQLTVDLMRADPYCDLSRVHASLRRARIHASCEDSVRVLAALIELQSMPSLGLLSLRELVRRDSNAYLEFHRDVATAIANGDCEGPLAHFILHGEDEGRSGFARVVDLATLARTAGLQISIPDVMNAVSNSGDSVRSESD